ncbi:MAG TPA: hypothetical protein VMJ34_22495 [Bryobacteraceae bacterium]|nr:hypothetical protein [Bryobacteraceae bacterium]
MRLLFPIALLALAALPAARAQDRDFLTPDEIQQVRDTQEPNARLLLYVKFARMRIEYLNHLLGEQKPGRSVLIHDTLEDYSNIIESIDTVADDALKRKVDIAPGIKLVADAEKEMIAALEKVAAKPPPDYSRYEFVLTTALDTTRDSADLSTEDLGKRSEEVAAEEARDKKERESVLTPGELKKKQAAEAEAKKHPPRKAPTLLKPGEKPATE